MNRRNFLQGCAGFTALAAARTFGITNLVYASQMPTASQGAGAANRDLLVFVFVRGGMDGLNAVIPFNTSPADTTSYYTTLRPTLNIPAPNSSEARKAVDLDGKFALHPDLARGAAGVNVPNPTDSDTGGLLKLFQGGDLAIVQAAGSPDITGSHFDTQHNIEVGGPTYQSGWLTRYLQATGAANDSLVVAPQNAVPVTLSQWYGATSIASPESFGGTFRANRAYNDDIVSAQRGLLRLMATGSEYVERTATSAMAAYDYLQPTLAGDYTPAAPYLVDRAIAPDGGQFGASLQTVARLAKAPELSANPLRVACVDVGGGFDTHDNEGTVDWAANSRFPSLMANLGNNLKAFHDDLSADPNLKGKFTIMVLSEFGRVMYQNNSLGCDHGAGNSLMLIGSGGNVNGGKVYGNWPGLQTMGFNDGVPITTDYRGIMADVLYTRMGASAANINDTIFPGLGFTTGLGYTRESATGILSPRAFLPVMGKGG